MSNYLTEDGWDELVNEKQALEAENAKLKHSIALIKNLLIYGTETNGVFWREDAVGIALDALGL